MLQEMRRSSVQWNWSTGCLDFQGENRETNSVRFLRTKQLQYQPFIKVIFLSLGIASSFAYGQKTSIYNMDEVRDVSLLELEVLRDWHPVATTPPTQQKIVEITFCKFENRRKDTDTGYSCGSGCETSLPFYRFLRQPRADGL